MDTTINFDNLRSITGGDRDMEATLLNLFLESSTECLAGLRAAQELNDGSLWEKHAHAMAGISLNLGAQKLGMLCKKAQKEYAAPPDEKGRQLTEIEQEWMCVCQFIEVILTRTATTHV